MPAKTSTDPSLQKSDAPFVFFALVLGLSVPFWVLGAVWDQEVMPALPISSLMIVCPTLAAVVLRWRAAGRAAVGRLMASMLDARKLGPPTMIALLVLINPVVFAASYVIQIALGVEMPPPEIALRPLLLLLGLFLVAGLLEELGWTGYALEPLLRRWGIVRAGVVIGLVWAVWHFVPLIQADRTIEWIVWWTVWTLAVRVLMVWLYTSSGRSVFGIGLYHALSNVCWQLYPVQGSFFDPRITALVALAVTVALVLVPRLTRQAD